MSHVHTFSCIRTFLFLSFDIKIAWYFFDCLSLSLSPFLFASYISCIMESKRKSTSSRNPLCSEASSSSSPSDPTPSHVRFRDEKAKLDFLEKFSWCGIHSKCQAVLSEFSDIGQSTIGVGSHIMASRSRALPWSYWSFTPICMDLITLYLSFLLTFEIYAW